MLINAYNACTLQLILDHWPVKSINDIAKSKRWDAKRWRIAGQTLSLTQMEHEYLRARFIEPRIHFAINCASVGCPPLRREAYTGDRIDAQLEDQLRIVHGEGSRWFRFDAGAGVLHLTKIYDWYKPDFTQTAGLAGRRGERGRWFDKDGKKSAGSLEQFVGAYAPPVKSAIDAGGTVRIEWLEYDWSLNGRR